MVNTANERGTAATFKSLKLRGKRATHSKKKKYVAFGGVHRHQRSTERDVNTMQGISFLLEPRTQDLAVRENEQCVMHGKHKVRALSTKMESEGK